MRKILQILKNSKTWLVLIILTGFLVRLYKIDNPVADWHSWRQADTAAVSRNFFKEGYNPLLPKYDDMIGIAEKPVPNPQRYRFVEFPIYNSIVYFAYVLNGSVDERFARFVSILFSLGSLVFVYLITKKYFFTFTATLAAFLFAVLPFNIYFSRVILPEPALVFFCLGMFYFTDRWIRDNSKGLYWLSLFFMMSAFLIKPMAIFYLLPLLYVYYQKEKKWWPVPIRYYLLIIPALLPLLFWRIWISRHPEGIPASNWLFNGNHIRFKPAFWRWIIQDRFGREILGVTGSFLFLIGLLKRPDPKSGLLLHLLGMSSLLYLIVVATGNVQHDYYQTLIVPAIVIFTARGFVLLLKGTQGFAPRIFTIPMALLFLPLTLYFGWGEVKGLYQINNGVIVDAGREADKILPKNAVVVAPYQGDTAFLYQTNRPGWSVVAYPIDDLKNMFGVKYYVSVNYDDKTNWLIKKFSVIEKNQKFVIIDLTHEQSDFYQKYKTEKERKEPP